MKQDYPFDLLAMVTLFVLLSAFVIGTAHGASRIKDVTHVHGLHSEKLVGYGLVVGLSGTGDGKKATFTTQSLVAMLERLGVSVDPSAVKVNNVAAVIVTADMHPFAAVGSHLDVTVNSVGDASSLDGGTLLLTPLKGASGYVHAVAQGAVSTGGFSIDAGGGNSVRKNQSTVGLVVNGADVTRPLERSFISDGVIKLSLMEPDFTTMNSVLSAINAKFGEGTAQALNATNAVITIPAGQQGSPIGFVAELERLTVTVDVAAKVVINEKTGTIVVGRNVEVGEAAIAHGDLQVEISTDFQVSQPDVLALGSTVVVPKVSAWVEDREARIFAVKESSTVGAIAQALNELGVTPRDIVAIFQALKRAGALRGELVIM